MSRTTVQISIDVIAPKLTATEIREVEEAIAEQVQPEVRKMLDRALGRIGPLAS